MNVHEKAKRSIIACYLLAGLLLVLVLLHGLVVMTDPAYVEEARRYEPIFSLTMSFSLVLFMLVFPIRSLLRLGRPNNDKNDGPNEG